jgi:hypothetical protein
MLWLECTITCYLEAMSKMNLECEHNMIHLFIIHVRKKGKNTINHINDILFDGPCIGNDVVV